MSPQTKAFYNYLTANVPNKEINELVNYLKDYTINGSLQEFADAYDITFNDSEMDDVYNNTSVRLKENWYEYGYTSYAVALEDFGFSKESVKELCAAEDELEEEEDDYGI